MAVTKLPADAQLDAATKAVPLSPDVKLDAPAPQPGFLERLDMALRPETVIKNLFSGPSVGEQLGAIQQRADQAASDEEKRLGRPLSVLEKARLELRSQKPSENPVAMAFGTHQIGEGTVSFGNAAASHAAALDKDFTRAVKPTVSGKQTSSRVGSYQENARDAVSSIVANKANLQFTDDLGNVVKGELPRTLEQFGQAIDQTKQKIFGEYDALAQQAGQRGATVDLMPAAKEAFQVAISKPVRDQHPEVARYAADLALRLAKRGTYTTSDAQQFIQMHNRARDAFYKNPTSEMVQRAPVDAAVASALRSELDQTIEKSVGPGYQDLKNKYGALKSIEKDVTHRAQIVGRQEPGGGLLGRLFSVASAEEAIRGLVTLNPAAIARGAGLKAFGEYTKYRRSPNRAVEQLFQRAEGGPQPLNAPPGIVTGIPISPFMVPSDSDTMRRAASP